ncbi:hypothetical protein MUN88_12080 [Gracilibacillus caseinilyticus]|uniref:Uncharacterized protein n=1 Tax=Gracilibacillus caseinilyticus TaxID=2932256 RepID=A0ABY4ERK0_9BACI|nr:hypothetical protein [Gracilibacillus caseinilyticus]UOQ46834.1 hypothetical protein MUN88_12080 [Gracilibacillus caseinilyticus]
MTMRLEFPLFMFIMFLLLAFNYFELFESLGMWQYIIGPIPLMLLGWILFDKLKLNEKRVGNGVGVMIILSGLSIWSFFDVFLFTN